MLKLTPKRRLRAKQLREYAEIVRPAVIERDGGLCVLCGAIGTDLHHVLGREGKRLTDIKHIVLLCHDCHEWAGGHIRASRAELLSLLTMRYYFSLDTC